MCTEEPLLVRLLGTHNACAGRPVDEDHGEGLCRGAERREVLDVHLALSDMIAGFNFGVLTSDEEGLPSVRRRIGGSADHDGSYRREKQQLATAHK